VIVREGSPERRSETTTSCIRPSTQTGRYFSDYDGWIINLVSSSGHSQRRSTICGCAAGELRRWLPRTRAWLRLRYFRDFRRQRQRHEVRRYGFVTIQRVMRKRKIPRSLYFWLQKRKLNHKSRIRHIKRHKIKHLN